MQEDALELLERAKLLNPATDGAEFSSLLKRSIELDPNNGEPHIYLGLYYYKARDFEKACEELSEGLNIDCFAANNVSLAQQAYVALGKAYSQQGNKEMALMSFRSLIGLFPETKVSEKLAQQIYGSKDVDQTWLTYYNEGCEAFSDGRFDEAEELFEAAENMNDSFPWIQYHLGLIYDARGDIDSATFSFLKAIEEERHYLFCIALANACYKLGNTNEERKCLNQALSINRHYAGKILNNIDEALNLGDTNRAEFLAEVINNQLPDTYYSEQASNLIEEFKNGTFVSPKVESQLVNEIYNDEQEFMFGPSEEEEKTVPETSNLNQSVVPQDVIKEQQHEEISYEEPKEDIVEPVVKRKISINPINNEPKEEVIEDETDAETAEYEQKIISQIHSARQDKEDISKSVEEEKEEVYREEPVKEDVDMSEFDKSFTNETSEEVHFEQDVSSDNVDEAFDKDDYKSTGLASMLNEAVSSVENYVEGYKIAPEVADKMVADIKEASTSARTVLDEIRQVCKIQIIAIRKQQELFLDAIKREVENVTLQACTSIAELEKALEVKIKESAKELIIEEEQKKLLEEESKAEEVTEEPAEEVTEEPAEEVTEEPAEEVTEEPVEEVTEEPVEEVTEEPAEEVTKEPAEKVTEEPAEEVTEEPAEEVTEEPAEEVTEEPAEEVTEEPAEEVTEEPAEEVTEEPAEEVTEEPAEEVTEEPAEEVTEEPAEEVTEEPAEEVIEEPAEEVIEEPAEEVIEEPAEEVTEEPAEEVTEEPVEEVIEEPAEEVTEEPAEEVIEEPAEEVTEEPAEEVTEEPTEEVTEEPAEEVTEEPEEEVTEEPVEEVTEEPEEEVTEEPAEEVTEEPAEEVTEEPAEEVTEEPAEEVTEPAEDDIDLDDLDLEDDDLDEELPSDDIDIDLDDEEDETELEEDDEESNVEAEEEAKAKAEEEARLKAEEEAKAKAEEEARLKAEEEAKAKAEEEARLKTEEEAKAKAEEEAKLKAEEEAKADSKKSKKAKKGKKGKK